MCVGRGLDSQAPSSSTLNTTTHLLNHLTFAGGAADLLLSGTTRQGARREALWNRQQGARRPAAPLEIEGVHALPPLAPLHTSLPP